MEKQRKIVIVATVAMCLVAAVIAWGDIALSQGIRAWYGVAEKVTAPVPDKPKYENNKVRLSEADRVYIDECYGSYQSQWLALSAKYGSGTFHHEETTYKISVMDADHNRKEREKWEKAKATDSKPYVPVFKSPIMIEHEPVNR
ncbi:hypothetical protein ACFL6I_05725 [candidate division KSB1 bacterium]